MTRKGKAMTADDLLLGERRVLGCFTLPALRCAWERVLKKDAQDGDLSDSVERFAEGVQERLEELAEELRAGTYRPSDLTRVVIPKKNGERFLDIPSVRDRIVERAILEHINPAIDPLLGATAFGYRPGMGVADAAQEVVRRREEGYTHVLRTDVHDCFPSLPVALLRRQLEFLIAEPEILAVVDLLLDRCTRFPGKGRGVFPGLPQGSPLSPLLANLALIPLDEALVDAGFPVVRYADDLVIALEEPGDAPEALRTATKVLKELGMELGAEKTAVASFFEGFAFLGEDFGPRYPPAESEGRIREPDKKILYVAKQGSRIQVRKGRVQVIQDDHELLSVPVSDISRMVCFGSVGVTAGARNWALQNGVDVLLASRRGKYLGAMVNDSWPARRSRVLAQLLLDRTPREVEIGREIIRAKLSHQVTLLGKFTKRSDADETREVTHHIRQLMRMLPDANNRDEIMGLEGAAARVYWPRLGSLVPEDVAFTVRSKQPPRDVLNAALSFLYTILLGECVTALRATGLDPDMGVLHADHDTRPSLALDLMEEFRPLVVDHIVVTAARKHVLTASHGREVADKGGIFLTAAGRELMLDAYERRMLTCVAGALDDFRSTRRGHLYQQAQRLRAAIMDPEQKWTGLAWR